MMAEIKKGISALQVKRMIGGTYKTAWYLCHRVRAAMKEDNPRPLHGHIEIDDTFVGGRHPGHENKFDNKVNVIGAVERGGHVRMEAVPNRGKGTFKAFTDKAIHDDAEVIYTDEYWTPGEFADQNTKHYTVKHAKRQYVLPGDIHTNTIEGVWALLKRSIAGSYHKLSRKHLQAYLDEMTWRYNNRDNSFLFRDTMLELLRAERLEYKRLTRVSSHDRVA
jgi:hypothetical protein